MKVFALLGFLFLFAFHFSSFGDKKMYRYNREQIEQRARFEALKAKDFCVKNHFDTNYIFLVDMSIPSGFNRFFIIDLDKDSIIFETLVAHGSGPNDSNQTWDGIPLDFSNVEDSHHSSLGRYLVGNRGKSIWGVGIKYELFGIDTSNNQARSRNIVLHSWPAVPDEEIYPEPLEMSWGCPAVSDSAFTIIDGFIYYRPRQMMMVIYR